MKQRIPLGRPNVTERAKVGRAVVMSGANVEGNIESSMFQGCKEITTVGEERIWWKVG